MSAKKILYLTDTRLAAWQWRGGKLSHAGNFNPDPEGLAGFGDYIGKSPNIPIYLLVDVIEEDFRNETIPHLLGKNRQALVSRKLSQLFRTATYRHASLQGREEGGRRDDQLLLTGLTNEELVKPWVARIAKDKLPLAGIYSVPLLSQVLAKKLGLSAAHQLLITRQASSGMRQSYFQEGQIKFSRLTLLSAEDMAALQGTVGREASRTQQYLNSLRLLPRDKPLDIAVCGARHLLQLQPEAINTPLLRYQLFSLEDIFKRLHFRIPEGEYTSEMLYLHLLGRYPPPQHYATQEQIWHNQLRLLRTGILGATVAMMAAATYVAATNINQALDDLHQGEKFVHEASGLRAQYQSIKSTFPPTPVSPENMKGTVELVEAASRMNVDPQPLLGLVSRALENAPAVKLNQMKWSVGDKPGEEASPAQPAAPVPPPSGQRAALDSAAPPIAIGPGKPYQIVEIEGEITPFTDYRGALDSVERFVGALKKYPSLQVALTAVPIDIGSSASQKGSAGKEGADKATFSLKLILAPTP